MSNNKFYIAYKNMLKAALFAAAFLIFFSQTNAQNTLSPNTDYLTEFGKMWTFDDLPLDYFKDKYNFVPDETWVEKLQKSALQFGRGCSGAFISADGLIMTNHHCGRGGLLTVQKEGEDLFKTGFYAETLKDERKIEGLYVDQLMLIRDVTEEVMEAMSEGNTDEEKVELKNEKISGLEKSYKDETGLISRVVTLYNGAKYSMYSYKRYDDIRVVMSPEFQIASTGWDWDNFTYPRYELDFMFLRAYENGKPAKTNFHFSWSKNGAEPGEPIFIIGRPGDTDRQLSVAELKFMRDVFNPYFVQYLDGVYDVYFELFKKYPERESELLNRIMSFGNSRKVYHGRQDGLQNEELMRRKITFEDELVNKVKNNPDLNKTYGHIWEALDDVFAEKSKIQQKLLLYNLISWGRSEYFDVASKVIEAAEQLKLPAEERELQYSEGIIDSTMDEIFPGEFDTELNKKLLRPFVSCAYLALGKDNDMVQKLFDGKKGETAADYMVSNSLITGKDKVKELLGRDPDEILNSGDPFIYFIVNTRDKLNEIRDRMREINNTLEVLNQELGEVIFDVYGDRIPPDATLTLRLSDGVIKGYEYNGTLAPPKTTFHGMYDRYYSFGEKLYPWGLPPRWQRPPANFDLSLPLDFAATLDIVGGNSGSSIVNENAEIVGLVFDGNMESLAGDYLYMPEDNRAIAVDSKGFIEALKKVYKTDRLVNEILNGKID